MYQLVSASDEKIHDFLTEQTIEWHFLPPQSPHMGGSVGIRSQVMQDSFS